MDHLPIQMLSGVGAIAQLIVSVVIYIYISYAVMVIAKKINVDNGWWAFVPILNIVLLFKMSEKPYWWIILMLIPIVNFIAIPVIMILLWMKIAEKRNKASWLGILMIIPFANLIVPGYLAFTE